MITVLTIQDAMPNNAWQKIGAYLKRTLPQVREQTHGTVTVRHVIFQKKHDRIPWKKIAKTLGAGREELLYGGSHRLPYGFKRYRSALFMYRMAENGALQVLKTLQLEPYRLKIGLYDPGAQHSTLLEDLLPFSAGICVVSDNLPFYTDKAEEIMQNSGAYVSVHKSPRALSACQVVIAPRKVRVPLPLTNSCVVFTGQHPAVPLSGILLDRFQIALPKEYAAIKPYSISDEAFACALYDKESQFSLGALKPRSYLSCGREMTMPDLCRFIKMQEKQWQ